MRGARVIATAGETFAQRLQALGATVTPYGDDMVERVRHIAGGSPDLVFDTAPLNIRPDLGPPGGVLSDLVAIAGGDPRRVMTCADLMGAGALGVRNGMGEEPAGPGGTMLRYDVLAQFAELAAEGRFSVPLARTFALEDWREALDISLSGRAHGKLVLLVGTPRTRSSSSLRLNHRAPPSIVSAILVSAATLLRRPGLLRPGPQ
jgi:NADPH:quinone reductase-like Zn-dependent oxidoreductase